MFQHVDDTLDRVPQGRASPADFAHSLRAGTGKFSLHYQPDRCHCAIHAIDEATFLRLYFQDPAFGMAIMKTITRRLLDGMARHPETYTALLPREPAPAVAAAAG